MATIDDLNQGQDETTQEIKKLREDFKAFLRNEQENKLAMLEAMREKKREREDRPSITNIFNKSKKEDDAFSAFKMLGGLAKLLAGAAASLATALTLAKLLRPGVATPDPLSTMTPQQISDLQSKVLPGATDAAINAGTVRAAVIVGSKGVNAGRIALQKASEKISTAPKVVQEAIPEQKSRLVTKSGTAFTKPAVPEVLKEAAWTTKATKAIGQILTSDLLAKVAAKSIPVAGAAAGFYFAFEKLKQGDLTGAGLEVVSGVGGAATAIPATVATIARDSYMSVFGSTPEGDSLVIGPAEVQNRMEWIYGEVWKQMQQKLTFADENQVPTPSMKSLKQGIPSSANLRDASQIRLGSTPAPATSAALSSSDNMVYNTTVGAPAMLAASGGGGVNVVAPTTVSSGGTSEAPISINPTRQQVGTGLDDLSSSLVPSLV